MTSPSENGIIHLKAHRSVDDVVDHLQTVLREKSIKLFTIIDHSGEAKSVGIEMLPTKLLIFGNPKAGTPLMLAAPSIAIDLPLKLLVWEDSHGQTWISYNSPAYLQHRHALPENLLQNIAAVEMLAADAAK